MKSRSGSSKSAVRLDQSVGLCISAVALLSLSLRGSPGLFAFLGYGMGCWTMAVLMWQTRVQIHQSYEVGRFRRLVLSPDYFPLWFAGFSQRRCLLDRSKMRIKLKTVTGLRQDSRETRGSFFPNNHPPADGRGVSRPASMIHDLLLSQMNERPSVGREN